MGAEPQPIRLIPLTPPLVRPMPPQTPAPYPTTPALLPLAAATPQPFAPARTNANEGARGLLWAIIGALVVLVLVAAGAVVWVASSRGSTNASTSPTPTADPTSAKKSKADDDEETPKKKKKSNKTSDDDDDTTAPSPKPETAPVAAMHEPGISIDEPEIVGQLDPKEVTKVLKRAMPTMQACRRSVADDVKAQIHVHPGPTITLAQPHPDNTGDPGVARCVAHKFQDAAPGWHPGDNGIIGFEVHLDAK
jgi:hypothetical protein